MTPEYKAEKEASVSYLSGGGVWEINFVTLVAPAAAFLWAILQTRQSFFKPYTAAAALTDFLLNCCGILFATTVYADGPQILLGLLFLPAIATVLQPSSTSSTRNASKPPSVDGSIVDGSNVAAPDPGEAKTHDPVVRSNELPVKPFITFYRGAMMIVTCTSILAVDFPVFPRRFAKTETFGTSLMDLGVGSFVFAAGLVAARQQLKEEQTPTPSSFMKRLKTALRPSVPLFVLGLVRLWSVKGLEYAEHVSEYGVHWNFFFTLALLPLAVAILQPLLRLIGYNSLFAFFFAMCYELILYLVPNMKRWLLLSERKEGDWLSQNREGVFSFLGYLAIFIAGTGCGLNILPRDPDPEEEKRKAKQADPLDEDEDWLASVLDDKPQPSIWDAEPKPLRPEFPKETLSRLAASTFLWFVAALWSMWKYGPWIMASRRLANQSYVYWVCAFNTAQLLLFCGIERVMFPNLYKGNAKDEKQRVQEATSLVMKAFNRNGLALFLMANLLTGAINLATPTWHMGDVEAMCVLVGYIGVICGTGLMLDRWDISIKF